MQKKMKIIRPWLDFIDYLFKLFIWLVLVAWCSTLYACSGGDRGAIPLNEWSNGEIIFFVVNLSLCLILLFRLIQVVKYRLSCFWRQGEWVSVTLYCIACLSGILFTIDILNIFGLWW